MSIEKYKPYFTRDNLMGPNCLRLLDNLLCSYPQQLNSSALILDLGCGMGITSYFLCRETGAKIYASDLWIDAQDNAARFESLGVGDMITPVQEDANCLSFEKEHFDAVVSIDSYHYFAGACGYFEKNILPYIKRGGMALICVPGIKDEFDDHAIELLSPWLGDEADLFKSPRQWKSIIGTCSDIEFVDIWEPDCFDSAWSEWFATGNRFAANDRLYFDSIIRPYTTFVAIAVKKKQI